MSDFKVYLVDKKQHDIKLFIEKQEKANTAILFSYYEIIFQILANEINIRHLLKVTNPLQYICNNFNGELKDNLLDEKSTEKIVNYLKAYEKQHKEISNNLLKVLNSISKQKEEQLQHQMTNLKEINKKIFIKPKKIHIQEQNIFQNELYEQIIKDSIFQISKNKKIQHTKEAEKSKEKEQIIIK